jgi:putative ABC transport system permease protein
LIGYDPETDFVIAPWISGQLKDNLKDGQIVVGNQVDAATGGALKFFGCKYKVAAKLEETGMGFDTSVFMNYHTAEQIMDSARKIGIRFKFEGTDLISAIMINTEDGDEPAALGDKILKRLEREGIKADVVIPQNIMSSASENIGKFVLYVKAFSAMLWILALILLTVVFTFSIHERKKEIAVLRILGATRKKLMQMVFSEAAMISAWGSVTGIILACIVVFPFNTYIAMRMEMPYMLPRPETIAVITVISFLLTFVIGPAASAYSAYRIGRNEIHVTMREGE